VAREESRRRTQQALRAVGLWAKAPAFPRTLSGGEQQRVAIARALVREPVILLADEPTGNVDGESAGEIMELFKLANARGTTVLVATHQQELALRMRQRTIQLMGGRVVKDSGGSA
jgi:cell division transport system ATP-binding protein